MKRAMQSMPSMANFAGIYEMGPSLDKNMSKLTETPSLMKKQSSTIWNHDAESATAPRQILVGKNLSTITYLGRMNEVELEELDLSNHNYIDDDNDVCGNYKPCESECQHEKQGGLALTEPTEDDDESKFASKDVVLPCVSGGPAAASCFASSSSIIMGMTSLAPTPAASVNGSPRETTYLYDLNNAAQAQGFEGGFHMDDLTNAKHLCNGSKSCVYSAKMVVKGGFAVPNSTATSADRKIDVIVKKISGSFATNKVALCEFNRERDILSRTSHAHLLKLYAVGVDDVDPNMPPMSFLVLERLNGGSLTAKILRWRKSGVNGNRPLYKYPRFLELARQFADALQYLHYGFSPKAMVIHRDLKPDNIGFTSDGDLKLMDFGLSVCVKRGLNGTESYRMTGGTGSLRYMAPEVAKSLSYNEKVDMYSFGLILYEMLSGDTPFSGMKMDVFMSKIVEGNARPDLDRTTRGRKIEAPDKEVKAFIKECWDSEPIKRPDATAAFALFNRLSMANPDQRRSGGCACS